MKRLIEFPLEDGSNIVVEVDEPHELRGTTPVARPGELFVKAQLTLAQALDKIQPAATGIITRLRTLSDPPDEISVAFGIKLSGEVGAFIASSGVEANYAVTLTWKRSESTTDE